MNNAREPGGGRQKTKLLRSYRFSLAFENSETPDYITEKFFDALMAGAVPVYLGMLRLTRGIVWWEFERYLAQKWTLTLPY